MSVDFGSPLSSANTNAKLMSRTQDTSTVGKVDVNNSTESTAKTNGALHTTGGLGVEKTAFVNQLKVDTFAGGRALKSTGKEVVESTVTTTELEHLTGASGNIQGQIDTKANDNAVVHNTGNETVAGIKTFTDDTNLDGDVVIGGNLTVNGTTTTVNSATLDVTDKNVTVNNGGNDATAEGAGLTVDRTGTSGSFVYEAALASKWKAGNLGSESEVITAAGTQTMTGAKTAADFKVSSSLKLQEIVDSTTTGSNAVLPTTAPTVRLTNASLVSIGNIDDVENGKVVIISNDTGGSIDILNDSTGTASLRILTGTGSDLGLEDNKTIIVSYNSNLSRWVIVGGSGSGGGVAYQETPTGTVNGVNNVFGPLTYLPSDANSILVSVDGVVRKQGTAFTVSGATITFQSGHTPQLGQDVYCYYLTGGAPAVPVLSGVFKVEYITLTGGDITAKQVTLTNTPGTASYTMLDLIGGGAQEFGVDFTVSGNVLGWNGLALDGVLASGDKFRVALVT